MTTKTTVSRSSFERVSMVDENPDLSYLGEYSSRPETVHIDREERGDWHMVGIRARVTLELPTSQGGTIEHTVESPGVWGVESDSDKAYIDEIFAEECSVLAEMIEALGNVELTD
jgi:hypothetical protein